MSAFVKSVSISKNIFVSLTTIIMTILVAACSGGGGGGGSSLSLTQVISGGAVDGPVTNADVTLYKINYSASVTTGDVVDTGTTDSQAKIQGLSIPFPLPAAPYAFILEFAANADTKDLSSCTDTTPPIDLTTCSAPVIGTMRTVITDEMISAGQNIYATPLTTMATNVALTNAVGGGTYDTDGIAGISVTEFKAALKASALQVTSMMGFGLSNEVDIFNTPPLIDSTTDTTAEQQDTADYRAAITSIAAVVDQMDKQAGGDAVAVFDELTKDMADGNIDGTVNGTASEIFSDTTLAVLDQDPSSLPIPNTDDGTGNPLTVADIEKLLADETAATGSATDTTSLTNGDVVAESAPAETKPDVDGDGVLNAADAFPDDATESVDTDNDGIGNNADTDDDNDGVADGPDAFPLDATETTDTDGDGTGNNADTDDDGDGTPDVSDDFPLDATKQNKSDVDNDGWDVDADPNDNDNTNPGIAFVDTDGDGLANSGGNLPDADDDNDGVADGSDAFPLDATETTDTDGNGIGNNTDTDDDGDGVADTKDAFPLDSTETKDTDKDGVGDNADLDADGDTRLDADEGATTQDTDADGVPDYLDLDSDNDKILDANEASLADVTIVNEPNVAPLASDDAVSINEDTQATGNLAATDANTADTLTYSLVASSDVNGTATLTNATSGAFTFDPTANFSGTASFKFIATDNATTPAKSNTATVTITVNAVNDAPVANAGTLAATEDTTATGTLSGSDTEGSVITFAVASNATNGTVTVSNAATGAYSYAPNANFNGSDSFTFVANDGTVDSATATVTVTVSAVNDAPVANAGTLAATEDTTATGTLSGSDTEGSSLTFATASNATNGTVTVTNAATGAYSYAPNANFTGTDSFTFVTNDGALSSTAATITITVNAVNDAPVANAGTLAATEDATATGTLSGSDTEGSSLTFAIASNATNGTVTVTNAATGAYSYAPNANFNGSDSFTFVANDGTVDSATATVTVTVSAVNDAPVANAGTLAATEDTTATGTLSGSDTEGSSLTFAVASNASNGVVTITNASTGAYSYVPAANFNGSDSFTFTANDGTVDSAAATVTITVGAVNDAPVATAGTLSATEDTTATGTVAGTDEEGSSLTFAVASNASNGVVTITNASTGAYSYVPAANFNGSDSFTFTANDGALSSTAATITITVNAVNDAPVANAGTLAATEDATATGTLSGSDTEGSSLTFAIASNATNGTVTITNASTGAYSYAPNANFNGSDSFTFTANDGALSSAAATITITVNAVNDAPVAVDDTAGVQPNNSVVINVLGNDTDNDNGDSKTVISVSAVTGAAGGTVVVTNSGADVTYTASTGEGVVTFTYTMQDAAAVQSSATVTVTITANPSPVAADGTLTVAEDSSNNPGTVSATDADPITYSVATATTSGTVTIIDANTGAYTYTPNANFTGTDSFTFIANDGISDSAPATVTITVTAANDIPVATAGTLTTAEDTTATGTVAGTDIDADSLTFAVNTNATNGVVTITDTATGAYSYVPNANFNGSDSFTFVANDGTVDSAPATVTITVSAVNDAPVATAGTLTTAQDTTATGTVAGTDVDGDSLTFTVNTNATNGVVTITDAATGAYSYVPTAGYNGSDSFTFVANDGTVDSAPATVTITVTASASTVDISGIWKMNITVTSATPIGGGSCDSVVGDAASIYITNAQSGSTVTVIAEEGQTMTGTVDTAGLGTLTGTFTATEPDLGQPTVDGATNTFSLDISFTTTSATTAGNMAGTLTLVDNFNGTQECTVVHNMTASYVYKQTGSENYNGVYAIEISEEREENFGSGIEFIEGQDGITAEFIFDAAADADGNVQLILPPGAGGTVTSSTYDPVTGFFSFVLEELAEEDWDGDGVIDDYQVITDNFWGITVRDSASSGGNGAPHLKMHGHNEARHYSDSAHTTQIGVARADNSVYGKLLATAGFTRTQLVTNSDGSKESRISIGLLNTPLQNAGGNLYLQVMDSSGITELCNAPYLETTDGAGDGRYSMNINMPHPDIQAENFRSGTFVGNVNCNTNATNGSEQVASGDVLPVSIIDAGVDGLIDSVSGGSDDTVVFSTTVTATPVVNTNGTDRYITAITRNNINVSGAKSSATMLGGSVPLFGYFDYSEDINVSFPVHTEGADKYQIRVQEGYAKHRFTTTGTAVTILAGSLPSQNMQLVAMKDDASGARAMSFSRRIQMQEGIRGFFNIELGDGVDENILQVYLDADMNGNVSWAHVTSNVSNFFCELVEIDRNTDVVTLTISDTNGLVTGTSGTNFDLKLDFKSTGTVTSGYAVVTSTAVPAIVNASARAVNSEMLMRTFVSDAGVEETSITMANAFDATNTYDDATFKALSGNLIVGGVDNAVTGKKMWTTGAGNTFLDKVKRFNGMPFDDGQPQFSGQYVTKKTGSTSWNLGSGLLAAGDYKIVTKDSATGLKTLNFAATYSAPSASAYVAPSLGDMTISVPLGAGDTVCSIGTACDSTTPVDVAANNGTWAITFTGSAPIGSLWQLILTEQMAFQEYRSPLMDPTVADSGIVNNDDGTYTLTNNGILFPTGDGIVVKVQVRVMDQKGKASTIIGQTRGGQAAYMTVP